MANAISLIQESLSMSTMPKLKVKLARDHLYNAEDILQKQAQQQHVKE